MFSMAFWILRVAPSPIDTVQITAATPMMTPSMVSAVRILLRPRARKAIRNVAVNSIQTLLWRAPRPDPIGEFRVNVEPVPDTNYRAIRRFVIYLAGARVPRPNPTSKYTYVGVCGKLQFQTFRD